MVEIMRGEAGREKREKFIEQRVMRVARVIIGKFVKAAHGFGTETFLGIWFATGSVVKRTGWKFSYLNIKFWNKSDEEVCIILIRKIGVSDEFQKDPDEIFE